MVLMWEIQLVVQMERAKALRLVGWLVDQMGFG